MNEFNTQAHFSTPMASDVSVLFAFPLLLALLLP